MTDTPELTPCPFCAGEARLYGINQNRERAHIECTKCRIVGPPFRKDSDAIDAWNKRAIPSDARRLVIAARTVAFNDWDGDSEEWAAARKELDEASEAFASRVPWDDEPDTHRIDGLEG